MFYYQVILLNNPIDSLTYESPNQIRVGTLVEIPLQRRVTLQKAVIYKEVQKPSFRCKPIATISEYFYDTKMLDIATFISKYYVCSLGEALGVYTPFYPVSKQEFVAPISSNIMLSTEQNNAYDFIQTHRVSLLFANTGSGKTEIYIKAIENILQQKKQALLLLPEISLSPQMEKRLQKVFGERVGIWHSKIQKKTKRLLIQNLLEGKIQVIAGARSALFLPYDNLGLIIVDEEHDEAYKADKKPRLNVKDVCIYMGKQQSIQVILGSATPSINSFYKIPYFRLKETYFPSEKEITFLNTNLELNQTIIHAIKETVSKKEQVILFLPTRANFKYLLCKECGEAVQCPFCSVSLSLHKNSNSLQCHYCHYTQAIPKICPSCQTGQLENFRLGTAEVFEQLEKIFPTQVIGKFDRDSIKTDTILKKVLKAFNDKKIDILIGTQMLSKGHDYHNVTLAVIMGIDSILNMTSYKVREKALSLLIQIAGRSGRKGKGKVLIQTKNQDFFHNYLDLEDYEDFLRAELLQRKNLYPPYCRLTRIIFSHKNALLAKKELDISVNRLRQQKDIILIGFGECSVFKIANNFRYELLIRSTHIQKMLTFLHSITSHCASIDMDTLY